MSNLENTDERSSEPDAQFRDQVGQLALLNVVSALKGLPDRDEGCGLRASKTVALLHDWADKDPVAQVIKEFLAGEDRFSVLGNDYFLAGIVPERKKSEIDLAIIFTKRGFELGYLSSLQPLKDAGIRINHGAKYAPRVPAAYVKKLGLCYGEIIQKVVGEFRAALKESTERKEAG